MNDNKKKRSSHLYQDPNVLREGEWVREEESTERKTKEDSGSERAGARNSFLLRHPGTGLPRVLQLH